MSTRPRETPGLLIAALNKRCESERLTNETVAERFGVSEGSVRLWRKMGRPPKNRLVREKLARWLGLDAFADRQAASAKNGARR